MLTVKHIRLCGVEDIYETQECRYTPATNSQVLAAAGQSQTDTPDTLWVDAGPLTGGTVFVMNEAGRTVSRYDLGASMVPPSVGHVVYTGNEQAAAA